MDKKKNLNCTATYLLNISVNTSASIFATVKGVGPLLLLPKKSIVFFVKPNKKYKWCIAFCGASQECGMCEGLTELKVLQ
jgi:hypothetical protein